MNPIGVTTTGNPVNTGPTSGANIGLASGLKPIWLIVSMYRKDAMVFYIFVVGMIFLLIRKFTMDFVVPIMYLRGNRCLEAWREFRPLLSANVGNFALYILFQIAISIVLGMMVLAILIVCCILCCFLMIPYVGAVVLLPITMFKRAYSLYYLAQYGPSYNVFQPAAVTQ